MSTDDNLVSIRRIHNPTATAIPNAVIELGLSLAGLGLFLFVQCQRNEFSTPQLAQRFHMSEADIDRLVRRQINMESWRLV